MTVIFLDIVFAGFVAALGVGIGWWTRGALTRLGNSDDNAAVDVSREVVSRLQELADTMAADVDEHSRNVQEISDQLSTPKGRKTENVVSAVEKIITANAQLQKQLDTAEERLHEQARQLESKAAEARTDPLTNLANRRAFDDAMKQAHADFVEHGHSACVMMTDVDHFKRFNDTYGHQAGDEVLRGVARTLRRSLSKAELVSRYGGEEFAVIFHNTSFDDVKAAAERARAAIGKATFSFEGQDLQVTSSAGLAELRLGEDIDIWIKRADQALYASKAAGRNCGHWHDGQHNRPLSEPAAPVDEETANDTSGLEDSSWPAELDLDQLQLDEAALEPEPVVDNDRHDPITGLANHTAFSEEVNRRVAEWKRGGAPVTVILAQVDDFSRLENDHGSTAGKTVLRATTQFLKATMREMDLVARYDNFTFGMLLPGAKLADATKVAERIRRAVARCQLPIGARQVKFTISLGVADARHDDTSNSLVDRTRAALDAAVSDGRNCTFSHNGQSCELAGNQAQLAAV